MTNVTNFGKTNLSSK